MRYFTIAAAVLISAASALILSVPDNESHLTLEVH